MSAGMRHESLTLNQVEFCLALDRIQFGAHIAAASVDPDGTARIELLARTSDGWHNMTYGGDTSSAGVAAKYDDVVVTHLPDQVIR